MKRQLKPDIVFSWSPSQVAAMELSSGQKLTATDIASLSLQTSGKTAVVGIARERTFIKTVRLPKVSGDDLRQLVFVQWKSLFPLDEAESAFCAHQTSDISPEGILTVVAAVRTTDLIAIREQLASKGIKQVHFVPLAATAAVALASNGVSDGLVVDANGDQTTFDLVAGGDTVLSRSVVHAESAEIEAKRTLLADGQSTAEVFVTPNVSFASAKPLTLDLLSVLADVTGHDLVSRQEQAAELASISKKNNRLSIYFLIAAVLLLAVVLTQRFDEEQIVIQGEAKWAKRVAKARSNRKIAELESKKETDYTNLLDPAFEPGQRLSDALASITNAVSGNVWLTGVNMDRGRPVQVRGTAMSNEAVTQFVNALGASDRFRDVQLVNASSAKIEQTEVVNFTMNLTVVSNVPLPKPQKAKKTAGTSKGADKS
ncbi:MAG: PilN domain-containing protein [Armatimonadota bacterium]